MVLKADWLYSSLLSRDQRIIHGFSTRCLMSGEGDATTKEQCESLISSLHIDPSRLQLMKQVHKDQISFIDTQSSLHPEVDAMTTDQPRIALGIRTADCVPVLMFDPILRVIAAVHAGWRGAVAQLPLKTIREMSIRFGSKPEQIW
ncbi:MAG TPA: laccase domain-containing protein, partial [Bdellovibrionota bacterium]|nr:laccase domain-containing protein [Bdellovibrionota bacterium]